VGIAGPPTRPPPPPTDRVSASPVGRPGTWPRWSPCWSSWRSASRCSSCA